MKGGIQARTTWKMYGSPVGASSSDFKDTEYESGAIQESEFDLNNSCVRSSTYAVQPGNKDFNSKRFQSDSRSSSNTGKEDVRFKLKGLL